VDGFAIFSANSIPSLLAPAATGKISPPFIGDRVEKRVSVPSQIRMALCATPVARAKPSTHGYLHRFPAFRADRSRANPATGDFRLHEESIDKILGPVNRNEINTFAVLFNDDPAAIVLARFSERQKPRGPNHDGKVAFLEDKSKLGSVARTWRDGKFVFGRVSEMLEALYGEEPADG